MYTGTDEQLINRLNATPPRGGITWQIASREAATRLAERNAEIAAANAELTRLSASQADAGAVMVEAALQLPAYDSDGDPAGQFDHHIFVRRDKIRALSTLSPIAAAARVLLASDAALTELAITTMRANRLNDGKRIGYQPALEVGLRALAEQEKADG